MEAEARRTTKVTGGEVGGDWRGSGGPGDAALRDVVAIAPDPEEVVALPGDQEAVDGPPGFGAAKISRSDAIKGVEIRVIYP